MPCCVAVTGVFHANKGVIGDSTILGAMAISYVWLPLTVEGVRVGGSQVRISAHSSESVSEMHVDVKVSPSSFAFVSP